MTGPKAGGHAEPRLVEDSQCGRGGTGSGGAGAVAEMAVAGSPQCCVSIINCPV